jgi:hypothetical protein
MLQRLTCSRTATVVCLMSGVHCGSLRAERGVGDGCEWNVAVSWGFGDTEKVRGAWRSAMGKRQCEEEGCSKQAADGGTQQCKAHGGGRRCQHEGCTKAAATGGTQRCIAHGGGKRCQHEGCSKGAEGGTQQCKTWGRQALSAQGLHQVCSRPHWALVMNLQFSILMAQTTDPSSWR